MSTMRLIRIIVLVPLGAACRSPAPGLELGKAEVLSAHTGVGAAPMVALSPGGARTVAWVSAPDGGADGRLYVSTNGAPVSELRDSLGGIEPHGEAPPKLAYASDGRLLGLYAVGKLVEGRRFPFTTLRLAESRDGGVTWSTPRTVTGDSTPGSRNFHALHVDNRGSVYVSWLESRDERKSGSYITRSDDSGLTWSPAVRVEIGEACPCCRTAIATGPAGEMYLAWRTVMPGSVRDIVVARSVDRGATWSAPVRVHADDWVFEGCPHAGPSMQVDARGRLHIMWWTGREGAAGVYYARSDDGAKSFGHVTPLGVAPFARPAHGQLALEGDSTVVAAWDDARSTLPRVTVRVSRNGGDDFGAEQVLSDTAVAATFPVLGLQNGNVTVAWSEQTQQAMAHAEHVRPDMKDPASRKQLPTVGEQRVLVRKGRLR